MCDVRRIISDILVYINQSHIDDRDLAASHIDVVGEKQKGNISCSTLFKSNDRRVKRTCCTLNTADFRSIDQSIRKIHLDMLSNQMIIQVNDEATVEQGHQ